MKKKKAAVRTWPWTPKLVKALEANGVEFVHPEGVYLAMIPWKLIIPGRGQPRTRFQRGPIMLLAETLKRKNPRYANNRTPNIVHQKFEVTKSLFQFELEDGERRWRAAQKARAEKTFLYRISGMR